jgi:hypothetical protein
VPKWAPSAAACRSTPCGRPAGADLMNQFRPRFTGKTLWGSDAGGKLRIFGAAKSKNFVRNDQIYLCSVGIFSA